MKRLDPASLTPRRIVEELNRYIVGQSEAKRVIAIAIRNRWRRMQLSEEERREIHPKNILLIGPTGVGKTEIARRIASLIGAPFLKVEATKYTEIGYVGRNVDSMIRDLVENSVRMAKSEALQEVSEEARKRAEDRILDALLTSKQGSGEETRPTRAQLRSQLRDGQLDLREIDVNVEERQAPFLQVFTEAGMEELGFDLGSLMGAPSKKVTRRMTVKEAKRILVQQEGEKLIDRDSVIREGVRMAEESGIVFIDELDKIVSTGTKGAGPEVSREGVQRDLLPIVEGSTVQTRYGPVRTDHMLFIAAGSFSASKPTDLIAELQGRFPLRAELKSLTEEDFVRILTEPKNALTVQYRALLAAERVDIEFLPDAVKEMARIAFRLNMSVQDIGARRLHTVAEKVLEDISFRAPELAPCRIRVDAGMVRERLQTLTQDEDLRRYIL